MKTYDQNIINDLNKYIFNLINSDLFYKNEEPEYQDEFKTYIFRIAYYNFINWQCENISKSTNNSLSIWGYNGTVLFNKLRNENIMKIDNMLNLYNNSIENVYCIPTTFGLIIDSYIVLQLKNIYNQKFSNSYNLDNQCKDLEKSIIQTLDMFYKKEIKFLIINKKKVFI